VDSSRRSVVAPGASEDRAGETAGLQAAPWPVWKGHWAGHHRVSLGASASNVIQELPSAPSAVHERMGLRRGVGNVHDWCWSVCDHLGRLVMAISTRMTQLIRHQ